MNIKKNKNNKKSIYPFKGVNIYIYMVKNILHHMTRPGSILRGVQIYLSQKKKYLARVRIWVISTVIAPNKHISCKSCSSRTRPSVTATMIAYMRNNIYIIKYNNKKKWKLVLI